MHKYLFGPINFQVQFCWCCLQKPLNSKLSMLKQIILTAESTTHRRCLLPLRFCQKTSISWIFMRSWMDISLIHSRKRKCATRRKIGLTHFSFENFSNIFDSSLHFRAQNGQSLANDDRRSLPNLVSQSNERILVFRSQIKHLVLHTLFLASMSIWMPVVLTRAWQVAFSPTRHAMCRGVSPSWNT